VNIKGPAKLLIKFIISFSSLNNVQVEKLAPSNKLRWVRLNS